MPPLSDKIQSISDQSYTPIDTNMKKNACFNVIYLLSASLSFLLFFVLIYRFIWQYGPLRVNTPVNQDILNSFNLPDGWDELKMPPSTQHTKTIGASPSAKTPTTPINAKQETPTLRPSPTPAWMTYDGIDFKDQMTEVLFTTTCDQENIYFEPFRVVPYEEGIFDSPAFAIEYDISVAWEHLGYYGLWVHSGLSQKKGELTAFPLQNYLETNKSGYIQTPAVFNERLKDCLLGSEVRIKQDRVLSVSRIVAAVRIAPEDVEEFNTHVMDLVPYLADTYPGNGFESLSPPSLVFSLCGRQLSGEVGNPDMGFWRQARIVFAVAPLN